MKLYPYLAISLIILIFNAFFIWGFNGLMIDDQGYYFRMFGETVSDLHFRRNIFHALFTLGIIKLATYTSIYFARLVIIILFAIPGAFLIYYFAHNHFRLIKAASVAIAVLPFILPGEVQVPAYMVGSYMLPGILAALISILFITRFSSREKFSTPDFLLAAVFYYIATECTELFATMVPAFLFIIFIYKHLSWKQFSLGATLAFIAVRKSWLVVHNPYGKINSVENHHPLNEIFYRVTHFPGFLNPLYGIGNVFILDIIIVTIILAAYILIMRNPDNLRIILEKDEKVEKRGKYYYLAFYFLLPATWIAFASIPFLFFSESFTSRYFTVASVASGFMIVISLLVVTGFFFKGKKPLIIISILIILVAGICRQINGNAFFSTLTQQYQSLRKTLLTSDFPHNAQIIVTMGAGNGLKLGNGVTNNSNGVYQYILERRDITGQIMVEKDFYDPFQIHHQPYVYRNMDVDSTKNTWLFRCHASDPERNARLNYALRWVDEKSMESPWTVYHFDENGNRTNLVSGTGYKNYVKITDSLSLQGITREDIMFGGVPGSNDSLRLGLRKNGNDE